MQKKKKISYFMTSISVSSADFQIHISKPDVF